MQIGDLVQRTYGKGQRPTGVIVKDDGHPYTIIVMWLSGICECVRRPHLKVINASR